MMRKILFIHQSSDLYGSDKTLLLLLKDLDKQQFLPVVVLPSEGPLKSELEQLGIRVVVTAVLKLHRKLFTPKNAIKFAGEVKKGISDLDALHDEYHFDLVYSNTLAVLLGMVYARKRKIKHIWHVHEIIVHPKQIAAVFPKLLYRYADIVVCNSKATMKNLTDRNKRLAQKTTLIYNGIENRPEPAKVLKSQFGFRETDTVITLVGRINRLKGHKLLLEAFVHYLNENQDVKLLFVGSPFQGQEYFLDEIRQTVVKNKLSEKVKIIPFTKELDSIWSITDIAVMPSTEAESFGLVAVEAMIARKPVVGSDHGGLSEIIIDGKTGLLVEPNSAKALAGALAKLIGNPELCNAYGNEGYRRATKVFSIESHVLKFEALFVQATSQATK